MCGIGHDTIARLVPSVPQAKPSGKNDPFDLPHREQALLTEGMSPVKRGPMTYRCQVPRRYQGVRPSRLRDRLRGLLKVLALAPLALLGACGTTAPGGRGAVAPDSQDAAVWLANDSRSTETIDNGRCFSTPTAASDRTASPASPMASSAAPAPRGSTALN